MPILQTVLYARKKSFRNPEITDPVELIPMRFRAIPGIKDNIHYILDFFCIKKREIPGENLPMCPPITFARRINILSIIFWKVSSMWYPEGREISKARKDMERILEFLADTDIDYESLLYTLVASGFFMTKDGDEPGIRLIVPVTQNRNILPSKIISRKKQDERHMLHLKNIHINEYDLYKDKDSSLIQYFCKKSEDPSLISEPSEKENLNWDSLRMKTSAIHPDEVPEFLEKSIKKNPGIIGFRRKRNRLNKSGEAEILAVSVHFLLDAEGVEEAFSCFSFANIAYLAVLQGYDELQKKESILKKIKESKIGLVCLSDKKDQDSWKEFIAPGFHEQKADTTASVIRSYFPKDVLNQYNYALALSESLPAMKS